ncbi:Signal transduction histidine kinase CheA [Thermogutta terrifontis]|uniref:Chemotaxis protein CheA n=1 Tax=Thermogutta terrifontis TaxID=1331910 RepID=A0A286RLM6_9BACT|nr:chemotaxis protein CheA [Thermogutta terrifontis]ASV76883.1 Signal transduction histidine kinase CheA [Thermogutta terrifontis]
MDAYLSDDMFQEMLGDFLDEATQLLDRLNENLLTLDEWLRQRPPSDATTFDVETLNEMFRAAHSLKGLSAMLNLTNINQLTHKLENLFDAARKNELRLDHDVVDLMFRAADRLRAMVEALKDPTPEPIEAADVVEAMIRVLEGERASASSLSRHVEQVLDHAVQGVQQVLTEEGSPPQERPLSLAVPKEFLDRAIAEFQQVTDEADLNSKYLALFIDELEQGLDSLSETLVAVEGGGTREELENILCTAHRIKGAAASVGFHRASKLAHLMEDVLQMLLDQGKSLTSELNDWLLRATDSLREFLEQLRQGTAPTVDFTPAAAALLAYQQVVAQGVNRAEQVSRHSPENNEVARSGQPQPEENASNQWPPAQLLEKAREFDRAVIVGRVELQPGLQLSGLKGQLLHEKLCHIGEVLEYIPPVDELEDRETLPAVEFIVATERSLEEVTQVLRVGGVRGIKLHPLTPERVVSPGNAAVGNSKSDGVVRGGAAQAAVKGNTGLPISSTHPDDQGNTKAKTAESAKSVETLRVDIERLDQLMNLAGQLVITRARLTELSEKLKQRFHGNRAVQILRGVKDSLERLAAWSDVDGPSRNSAGLSRLSWNRLEKELDLLSQELEAVAEARVAVNQLMEAVHQLDRVTDGIQRAVMETRMVPIGPLFNRFKRVVRDVTRLNGKHIQLVINGEKTELDKRMIDELGDPLIHLVRNAADHGIEPPEVRAKLGKPPVGTITLNAFHRGNSIVIEVSDDGKGLDADRILKKALDRNLISPAQAEKMSREEIYQLIFLPGLSTAEKVTEVSGRGMGMDIVKAKIEELSGAIELASEPGVGTKVTIKLPLTLAILPSLLVRIDGDVFAMPIEAVREIVAARRDNLTTVHGMKTARIRDRVISVIELGEVFASHCYGSCFGDGSREETTLVVLGDEEHEVGLVVDEVLGEEDVVIKSIAENYRNIPGIAGASILGNGRVSLILDVAALLGMIGRRSAAYS